MKFLQNKKFSYLLSTPALIKNWVLLVLAAVFLIIGIISLRLNNLGMIELRNAVLAQDQDNEMIEEALDDLRSYISRHMNTTPEQPLELIYSYDRAYQEEVERVSQSGIDVSINQRAQEECERLDIPLTVRAQCIQDYIVDNTPEGQSVADIEAPDRAPFIHEFSAPVWSFDIAGVSLFASLYTVVVVIARKISTRLAVKRLRDKGLDELMQGKIDTL